MIRLRLVTAALAVLFVLVSAGPAAADPPGPTDYRTEVLSIVPDVEGIELSIIGGDSFVRLEVTGREVVVSGYRGEPYLRFDADGGVYENQRSPARWLNEERYGEVDLPASVDPAADPEWIQVADDGSYAWHDHRTHWMNATRPPGKGPGDVILQAVVLLQVDGEAVSVTVESVWVEAPSPVPALLGGIVGLAAVAGWWLSGRKIDVLFAAVAATAAAATVVAVAAYRSVPAETGPSAVGWVSGGLSLLAALVAVVRRSDLFVSRALVAVAGLALVIWGWLRREALSRAIIPTDAPPGLERAVVVMSLLVGAVSLAAAVTAIVRPQEY